MAGNKLEGKRPKLQELTKDQMVKVVEMLFEAAENDEGQSPAEIRAELEAGGIDVDVAVGRLMEVVRSCSQKAKEKKRDKNKQRRNAGLIAQS